MYLYVLLKNVNYTILYYTILHVHVLWYYYDKLLDQNHLMWNKKKTKRELYSIAQNIMILLLSLRCIDWNAGNEGEFQQ
jgi:hypothetical protein